ncbi:response regulator [Arenibacter algicola]|uniref:response regulator n=1 Tax=Arenibacter algicola TaxID=616991 RepID=UPI0004DED438|nr:response regulator [Arenibacter algicola]
MKTTYNKVMVVDDNKLDIYFTTKLILKNSLAENVLEFTSAEGAYDYLRDNQTEKSELPGIIFIDIYMPNLDGFEFIDKIRELGENITENCRLCIVSSTVSDYDIHKAKIEKGIPLFSSKPITSEFIERLANLQ